METLPTEILKMICITYSTYRTQCTIVNVCTMWAKIILSPDISPADLKKINYIVIHRRRNDPRNGKFKYPLLILLQVILPEYRLLFISREFASARRIIFGYW